MEEKTVKQDGQFEKYPYSFELRINDNIVCQRYFKINGFREASLESNELTDTLRYCAQLIKDDLRSKSNLYYEYTAPQIFKDEAQMREWEWWNARRYMSLEDITKELGDDTIFERKYTFTIEPCSYVILEDEDKSLSSENLASYKTPTVVVLHREELPKTSTRKVKRRDLLQWYESCSV